MKTAQQVSSNTKNCCMISHNSQMASWLGETDWICCIRCCCRPYESKNSFFVSDCGHIYCNNCKEAVKKCTKCLRTGIKFLLITENVKEHPLVGDFFHDPLELLKKTLKMLEFQQAHKRRDLLHQRQTGEPSLCELRKQYGELAELSSKELQSGLNKKMAYYNQEEQKLKGLCSQVKLLFDETVSLVRHMKQMGWDEQTLTFQERNGRLINGVELLRYVAALLSAIMKNGEMENQRIGSSQNGNVTPLHVPPSRPVASTNRCQPNHDMQTSPPKPRRPPLAPPPPPPPFPPHLKMMCSQQPMETQNTGTSPMSWQPSMSQVGRGMPPPRLPPSRKLAPPTSSLVYPCNQSGILTPTTTTPRHYQHQQTTPSSVAMTTVPYTTSLDYNTPMECSSSYFSKRNKLPTPDSVRVNPSPSQAAIPRVTPTHHLSTTNRSRPPSATASIRSASPSPFTTPQKTPSSLKRISIRGPPSGGKIGTTPGGNLTPDSSLYKIIQEKRHTPQSQSPSPSLRGGVAHTSGGARGRVSRTVHGHHHPHSSSRTLQGGRRPMMVVSHRRPGT